MARRSRHRHQTTWIPFSAKIDGVATSSSIDATNVISFNGPGTILRIRGQGLVNMDAPTDGDCATLFWGLFVANDDLVAENGIHVV